VNFCQIGLFTGLRKPVRIFAVTACSWALNLPLQKPTTKANQSGAAQTKAALSFIQDQLTSKSPEKKTPRVSEPSELLCVKYVITFDKLRMTEFLEVGIP